MAFWGRAVATNEKGVGPGRHVPRGTPLATSIEVDRARPVEAGSRSSGGPTRSRTTSVIRRGRRRRLAGPAGRPLITTDMDQTVQEGAGRDNQRLAIDSRRRSRAPAPPRDRRQRDPARAPQDPLDVAVALQRPSYPLAVPPLVRLGPWRPDGWPSTPIQHFELKSSRVDGLPHQPAKCVYLSDQMTFSGASDGWIAGHERYGVRRQRTQTDRTTERAPPPPASTPACPAPITTTPNFIMINSLIISIRDESIESALHARLPTFDELLIFQQRFAPGRRLLWGGSASACLLPGLNGPCARGSTACRGLVISWLRL